VNYYCYIYIYRSYTIYKLVQIWSREAEPSCFHSQGAVKGWRGGEERSEATWERRRENFRHNFEQLSNKFTQTRNKNEQSQVGWLKWLLWRGGLNAPLNTHPPILTAICPSHLITATLYMQKKSVMKIHSTMKESTLLRLTQLKIRSTQGTDVSVRREGKGRSWVIYM